MLRKILPIFVLLTASFISEQPTAQPYPRSAVLDEAISFHQARMKNEAIHYAQAGDEDKPGLIFVHGTPGGWQAFEMYLESDALQQEFLMISVDRLGWGRSTMELGKVDGNFVLQADSIVAVSYTHLTLPTTPYV